MTSGATAAPRQTRRSLRFVILVSGVAALLAAAFLADPQGRRASPEVNIDDGAATSQAQAASASGNVSLEDFCAAFTSLQKALGAFAASETSSIQEARSQAQTVQDLAARTVMPRTALAGLNYVLGLIIALDDSATPEDLMAADTDAGIDDSANATDFATWHADACLLG